MIDTSLHDERAERELLGAMFVKNAIAGIVPLAPDDFSTSNHQKICRAIQSERDKGEPFGITTISDASGVHSSDISTLLDDPINDDPGYLVKLAKKLHNLALKRQLFAHGQTLCRSAMNGGDALEIIDRHLGKLEGLREGSGGKDWRDLSHIRGEYQRPASEVCYRRFPARSRDYHDRRARRPRQDFSHAQHDEIAAHGRTTVQL